METFRDGAFYGANGVAFDIAPTSDAARSPMRYWLGDNNRSQLLSL
jgi:hypothetical protein